MADWHKAFLDQHRLPGDYLQSAARWFDPLASAIAWQQERQQRPILVGINGSQGSGKTTVCDYLRNHLAASHGLNAVCLSLDDGYHTLAKRQQLAHDVHPLLATRGVPGTHDSALLTKTLKRLLDKDGQGSIAVPRFDKSRDDRSEPSTWPLHALPVDVVLLEGWCLGAVAVSATDLEAPVNELEASEDADGTWRTFVNDALRSDLMPLYASIDLWVMLRAPSFDCVFEWRREQERKLAASTPDNAGSRIMDESDLRRFVAHFERLTRHCLDELPARVDHLYQLDRHRQIIEYRHSDVSEVRQ